MIAAPLFRQAGVIRTATVEEAFDAAAAFATQPLPSGPNVAVITTAGGWGVVTADHQREAAAVVAENVPGVKQVKNHIAWIEPTSGMMLYQSPEDQEPKNAA